MTNTTKGSDMKGDEVARYARIHRALSQAIYDDKYKYNVEFSLDKARARAVNEADEELQRLIKNYTYDKKSELIREIRGLIPNCDDGCEHKDTHQGHWHIWWQGYNQAKSELHAILDRVEKGERL